MALLLDTHIWLWYMGADKRLPAAYTEYLQNTQDELAVSAMSVLEVAQLAHRGRVSLDRNPRAWVMASLGKLGMEVIPLTADIALESYALPGEFHGDPADRMIIATARQHGLTLVTRDKSILAYAKKGHIRVVGK